MFIPLAAPDCYSDYMLFEMLATHEALLKQMRRELLGMTNRDDWLRNRITQHEEDAVQIGLLLENCPPTSA